MRPLNRSIAFVSAVFFTLLCIVLSAATYHIYSNSMYERYRKELSSVVTYFEERIDHDDMAQCAKTYVESEKYRETQAMFDSFIDSFEDIHYLYLMDANTEQEHPRLIELCTANSTWEKEHEPENVLHLGDWEEDWYPEDTVWNFVRIQRGDEDVYFLNPSQWGVDYTLARPVKDSQGNHYGILCADISVKELRATIYRNIYINIAVIVLAGIAFIVLLLLWMRVNVVVPLKKLEQSLADFARRSSGRRDPKELIYNPPEIHTRNEVQSLAEEVLKLFVDMQEYVQWLMAAEDQTRGLRAHVSKMKSIAYRDSLTKVKNKTAYDKKVQALSWDIVNKIARFAIVMVDLNNLKLINDRYGHEHGNEYITGACGIICDIFDSAQVYRVGGDEFLAVLQGKDYEDREALCQELRTLFARSAGAEDAEPWLRYSAAVGMGVYESGDDVEAVFTRADQEMYKAKTEMKAHRA